MSRYLLAPLLLAAGPAAAHQAEGAAGWAWDAWIVVPLAVSGLWFLAGLIRLWRRAGWGAGVQAWRAACWWIGWGLLVLALLSPLQNLADGLFWVHMTEHEILMAWAAPLLVLGQPAFIVLWGMPRGWRRGVGAAAARIAGSRIWRVLTGPAAATVIHGLAIWVWHLPVCFDAALRHEGVHALQHASFLLSALLFWWALLDSRERARSYGRAVLYLFVTTVHTSVLGALLVVSTRTWYRGQDALVRDWHLSPLMDQQLGGLIMWVPGGLVYAVAALVLFGLWLARLSGGSERRDVARTA